LKYTCFVKSRQSLTPACKHLFSRDEMKYHEEDRMAEKGLDLPAGRQGGTSEAFGYKPWKTHEHLYFKQQ
jgi:hypothetical protein